MNLVNAIYELDSPIPLRANRTGSRINQAGSISRQATFRLAQDTRYNGEHPTLQFAAMNLSPKQHRHDSIIVETVLANLDGVVSLYRFGSAGSEFERADSDLDLAILANHKLTFDERLHLSARLSEVVEQDVDVLDMRTIPVTLRVQIAANGIQLFARDPNEAAEFESRAFSDYARLNEERANILSDIRQRGRIYG